MRRPKKWGDDVTYRRGWIALLIFSVVIINYIDRVALSVAAKPIAAEFGFTPIEMGYLFSGFCGPTWFVLFRWGFWSSELAPGTWSAAAVLRSGRQRLLLQQPPAALSRPVDKPE